MRRQHERPNPIRSRHMAVHQGQLESVGVRGPNRLCIGSVVAMIKTPTWLIHAQWIPVFGIGITMYVYHRDYLVSHIETRFMISAAWHSAMVAVATVLVIGLLSGVWL